MGRKRDEIENVQITVRQPRTNTKIDAIEANEGSFRPRIKESLRKALEAKAAERGVSMNVEITDRLEKSLIDSDALNFFFRGGASLEEVLILRRYLEAIKAATVRAGERADRWWVYAAVAPFALDREKLAQSWIGGSMDAGAFDIEAMTAPIRKQVERNILDEAANTLEKNGTPGLPIAYNSKEEALAAADHMYSLWKGCEVLLNLRRFEDGAKLRRKYGAIYKAASEWAKLKSELSAVERERYAAILELAKIEA